VFSFTAHATLLALELTTPFFGWWHAASLMTGIGASLIFATGL